MNLDGSNSTRLAGEDLKATIPIWSPDGSQIAFSGGHHRQVELGVVFDGNLAVMASDGSNPQVLTPESNILMFPYFWLPEGQRLIFEGTDEAGFSHIYTIQADGSDLNCITCPPPPSGNTFEIFWYQLTLSPTGQQVAYVGRDDDLYVVDTGSGTQHNLTPALAERVVQPAWSPEGQRLAFGREDVDPGLAVINADGSNMTSLPVPAGAVYEPLWSPDGQKIVFTYFLTSEEEMGGEDLYVINADGTGLTRLTSTIDQMRFIENYIWTPDSTQLIFATTLDEDITKSALYQVNVDGSNLTRLTEPSDAVSIGTWLPQ